MLLPGTCAVSFVGVVLIMDIVWCLRCQRLRCDSEESEYRCTNYESVHSLLAKLLNLA